MNKHMICIACPRGCPLQVETAENGDVLSVCGNACKRGVAYAHAELTHPVRQVTTTVRVKGGDCLLVPVRSSKPIPKSKVLETVRLLHGIKLTAPVNSGDVAVKNILGTGVDIIVTGESKQKETR